ncbi:hypothetical protein OG21DRAFT_1194592 [Imleria badia]|nr:hypothetical protein OG21DRAFT_1194592 [Imleria badia]
MGCCFTDDELTFLYVRIGRTYLPEQGNQERKKINHVLKLTSIVAGWACHMITARRFDQHSMWRQGLWPHSFRRGRGGTFNETLVRHIALAMYQFLGGKKKHQNATCVNITTDSDGL